MRRPHPYRRALWLTWFGLALCGGWLIYDLLIGLWVGVGAMAVLIVLAVWLLLDIRRRRLEWEQWQRDLHR